MSQIVAFKSAILRAALADLSVSSFSVSFPSDDIALFPCTITANASAGVVDINTSSSGLYSNGVEIQSAAFDIADFILKYADISNEAIQLTIGSGSWFSSTVFTADRAAIALLISNQLA